MQMCELVLEDTRLEQTRRRQTGGRRNEDGRKATGFDWLAEASKDERARHSSCQRAIRGQKQLAEIREAADVEMAGVLQRAFIKPPPVVCRAVRTCSCVKETRLPEGEGPS